MRRVARCLLVVALITAVLAGCSSSDSADVTRESVELAMTAALRADLPEGTSLARLECIEDGDRYHWRCITLKTDATDVRLRISLSVTCDRETGRCLAEPQAAAVLP